MDLFDHISENQSSPLFVKDKTYDKIVDHLDDFVKSLPEKDKKILLQIISRCYLKYRDSIIKGSGRSIFELNIKLLLAMLLDQKVENNKT